MDAMPKRTDDKNRYFNILPNNHSRCVAPHMRTACAPPHAHHRMRTTACAPPHAPSSRAARPRLTHTLPHPAFLSCSSVVLSRVGDDETTEYINANFVGGYNGVRGRAAMRACASAAGCRWP